MKKTLRKIKMPKSILGDQPAEILRTRCLQIMDASGAPRITLETLGEYGYPVMGFFALAGDIRIALGCNTDIMESPQITICQGEDGPRATLGFPLHDIPVPPGSDPIQCPQRGPDLQFYDGDMTVKSAFGFDRFYKPRLFIGTPRRGSSDDGPQFIDGPPPAGVSLVDNTSDAGAGPYIPPDIEATLRALFKPPATRIQEPMFSEESRAYWENWLATWIVKMPN